MARFKGKVGYGVQTKVGPGTWTDVITERVYDGVILNATRTLVPSEGVNDDVRFSDRISIVADSFALGNYINIKYVEKAGFLWTVTSVEVQRPRLILTLGGVWDGARPA